MKFEKDGPNGNQKLIEAGLNVKNLSPTSLTFNDKFENIEIILQEINNIFQIKGSLPLDLIVASNITKEFSRILSEFLDTIKPQSPLTKLKKEADEILKQHLFLGNYFVNLAKMLSKFPYFVSLDFNEKNALFKRFWQIFHILERCYQAAEYFGEDLNDFRFVIGNKHFVDLENLHDFFNETEKSKDAQIFLTPLLNRAPYILTLFKRLRITVVELAYISLLALWFCFA
uniref:NR LBD domain-containing protein n=1 Tax=Panagrolaimus sp. ES5 TaxID=591445 RepID=A0AC34GSQ9_9BILA